MTYHLRLIGERIGYDFPKGSVHEHIAEFYGVDYEESEVIISISIWFYTI